MKKSPLPFNLIVWAVRGAIFVGAGLALVQPCAADPGGFELTGSLASAREQNTATLLGNGKVLVVGGEGGSGFLASAELYDSASGIWSATGSLKTARERHTATLLSNGMVLVVGGLTSNGITASAELYDPANGSWTATGSLNTARESHTATLLSEGMVLVTGGVPVAGGTSPSAELYNPASGIWTATGNLNFRRSDHTATLLPDGMVLVAGGTAQTSAELYDPALGTWLVTGDLNTGRYIHTATLLPNGMVLVAGGLGNGVQASAEIYDPTSGVWTTTGSLNTARYYHTATLLSNGMVLVAGGMPVGGGASPSAEIYDPASGTWSATGSLNVGRYDHTATMLPNGMVLVAGGYVSGAASASAELYDPSPPIITSPLAASATASLAFSYQFEAPGATSLAVDDRTLPQGLIFDPALRAIVGNPIEGTFQIGLSATNQFGTTNANLVLTVQPLPASGPVIISVTSATGRTGSPFKFQVITSGGTAAARVTATGLPPGLNIDSETGEISGTATTDGSFLVTLFATDAGLTNIATLQLTFTSDLAVPVITSANSAFLFPGLNFLFTIDAPVSDSLDPVTYSKVGPLPLGLGLDPAEGVIAGIPNIGSGLQPAPSLAGGVVSNVQIFACNASGCAAQGLFFLLPTGAANISTRLSVGTDENVLIGGFITEGNAPMKLVMRGIGPSLAQSNVSGPLLNPYLELHNGATLVASNDNWKDNLTGGSQEAAIENTGLAPSDPLESAILGVLNPGGYTATLKGVSNGTGVGLVEVYNLGAASMDLSSEAHLANISTRGKVQTGDNVMIGGFINQGATPIQVLVRGIGPSLTPFGVSGALANPVLELHKPDGTVVTNDDWMSTQKADIMMTGLAPTNPLESSILLTLPVGEGSYTAIVSGANGTTGVGLVEAYFGNPCLGTSCP